MIATALLVAGVLCVVAEVFFPSLGILALFAVLSLAGSVVFGFRESTELGWTFLVASVGGGFGSALIAFKIFPRTRFGKRMIVDGPTFSSDPAATDPETRDLLGRSGRAMSVLRPAGVAEVDGRRIDCVADGELLEPGTPIVVTALDGNRVVVRRAPESKPS
ncbi:MAG: hypothetical protein JNJ88_09330 [Planctomycetes bacterium]|nr:hypothetical protein [Planctomycetota bacterium]